VIADVRVGRTHAGADDPHQYLVGPRILDADRSHSLGVRRQRQ
jgi:hypothetical protein